MTTYKTDKAGNIINPPVIRSFEQELAEASAAADADAIADIQERYDKARKERARVTPSDDGDKPLSKMTKSELRTTADAEGVDWTDDDTNETLRDNIQHVRDSQHAPDNRGVAA